MPKLRVGFFSFTGDEGCITNILEVFNHKFAKWQSGIDIVYSKAFRSKNSLANLDLAFVEGAISTKDEVARVKQVRKACKTLVAIGSCAISGSPSNHRNFFAQAERKEIAPVLKKFSYLDKVYPLSRFVKVDAQVPGCPVDDSAFIAFMEGKINARRKP